MNSQVDSQEHSVEPSHIPSVDESDAKAGSAIATLWLKVNQDNQPPASIPSTLLPLESNQNAEPTLSGEVGDNDLLRLLEQAASESLENMKPKKKRK